MGLRELAYAPMRGQARSVPIDAGLPALRLPFGALVTDRAPSLSPMPLYDPRDGHGTIDMIQRVAASPGFSGHLDDRRHMDRFFCDAGQRGSAADESVFYGAFAAFAGDRLCCFAADQSSWAAAFGQALPMLAHMDSRLDLLRCALEWLDDSGFEAVLERALARPYFPSYDRDAARAARVLERGRLAIGPAGEELELSLTAAERERFDRWLADAG